MSKVVFKSFSYYLIIISILFTSGCATLNSWMGADEKVDGGASNFFETYKKERPDTVAADLGSVSGNQITAGIAGIYGKSIELAENYLTQLENHKVASVLEGIRHELGQEAYEKAYNELGAEDRAEYDTFMRHNVDFLAVAIGYAEEAAKLSIGIIQFDVKEYTSNPMAIITALQGLSKATDQIQYTITTFDLLIETRSVYQAMLEGTGK